MSQNKLVFIFFLFLSFFLVGFGQPATSYFLSIGASFFGFALFWASLELFKDKKQKMLAAFVWFFFVQAVQLSWMSTTTYHGFFILIGYFFVLTWLAIQFSFLTFFIPYNAFFSYTRCLAIAGLWTIMEWSRLFFLCGFPFNPVGISLSSSPLFFQTASIFGVFGLSFLVIFLNFLALKCWNSKSKKEIRIYLSSICVIIIYGLITTIYHESSQKLSLKKCKVALIQTGLRPEEKGPLEGKEKDYVNPYDQWIRILGLLQQSNSKRFDLILLPEAVIPYGANRDVYSIEDVKSILNGFWGENSLDFLPVQGESNHLVSNAFWCKSIANYYQSMLVAGFDDYDPILKTSFNAAFYFSPQEEAFQKYDKMILVPLGEYIPFKFLKKIAEKYGIFDFFSSGKKKVLFGDEIKLSPSICFEECFGHFMHKQRKDKIDLFVNLTNDGWFLPSALAKQHFYHARLRSVENGTPLIRACNTGVTGVIDATGKIRLTLPCYNQQGFLYKGVLIDEVPLYSYFTLYTVWGDTCIVFLSIFFFCIFIFNEKSILKILTIRCSRC